MAFDVVRIWVLVAVFNFLFIMILVANPREIRDSDNNLNFHLVFWYALASLLFLAFLYFILIVITERIHKASAATVL